MLGGLYLFALAIIAARILFLLYRQSTSPLRHIPGPFWTRFTRAWYLYRVSKGHFETDNIALHHELGPIVRVAPGWYSCSGTEATKKIYALGTKFTKSDWYDGWSNPDPKQWTMFSDKNIKRHAETRKLFANLYSVSSLMAYEPFVDRCIDLLVERLVEFSKADQEIDLGHWLQCYAFDVIGCITFGERIGFLDSGEDISGIIEAVHALAPMSTLSGIYHEWRPTLFKVNSYFSNSGANGRIHLLNFAKERIIKHKQQDNEKMAKLTTQDQKDATDDGAITSRTENGTTSREPFMSKMIRFQRENPERVTDYHLAMLGRSNLGAGFDTTAISLTSMIYHLIKTPRVLQKLRDELDTARKAGRLSERITFHESQELSYFQAVMKEALRMHSATGLPLWRTVPEGGLELNGMYFPEGTVLGVNSWVSHYDKDVFTNPNEFYPERWIDQDEAKLKAMKELYMPFGLGSRACIGRHISILEMSKLIPVLVEKFDFVKSSSPLETSNFWFVEIRNFKVRGYQRG